MGTLRVGFGSILLLSVGLAMDAMAVSAARGLVVPRVLPRHALLVALFFGGSQALMPLLGWALGALLGDLVASFEHWIAAALLAVLGLKMLWEARAEDDEGGAKPSDPFAPTVMFGLAIATSIDAFAVGVTLPMLAAPMAVSLATIGLVTAALSVLGLHLGRRVGAVLGKRLDVVGGLVLLGLAAKILIEGLA